MFRLSNLIKSTLENEKSRSLDGNIIIGIWQIDVICFVIIVIWESNCKWKKDFGFGRYF